jgi:branched-chain amino acid transport system permease protein
MIYVQVLANGIVLGSLYALIASGFSLVWGVLNVINLVHGSLIVLGAYMAWGLYETYGLAPWWSLLLAIPPFFLLGYLLQRFLINRVMSAPVLVTLTLTFGLELIASNVMLYFFTADYRRLLMQPSLGLLEMGSVIIPKDRLGAMALALVMTMSLYILLRQSRIGRAIVAVRVDAEAAKLMGVNVANIYATAFGIGAAMAGCAGTLMALVFPFSPVVSTTFLGKAFVVCVLGGLGSVPGAIVGGIVLGVTEAFGSLIFGAEYAVTLAFSLLIAFLIVRPQGLLGRWGFE